MARVTLDHLVEVGGRLRDVAQTVGDLGHSQLGVGLGLRILEHRRQDRRRILHPRGPNIIVGEGEPRRRRFCGFSGDLQRFLGLRVAPGGDIKRRHHAVGERVARRQGERLAQRRFGQHRVTGRQIEVHQREPCLERLGIELDGLLERRFGRLASALGHLEQRQVGIRDGIGRIDLDRLLDLPYSSVEIPQADERIGIEDLGLHVLRVLLQHGLNPGADVFVLASHEEERGGPPLDLGIVGQQVGGALIFAVGPLHVPRRRERLGKLCSCLAESVVDVEGVAVLENRGGVLLLRGEAVAALEIAPLGGV